MSETYDDERGSADDIWENSVTLSPDDTKGAKIHLTLRLDPHVYREILAVKKAGKDRTITSTMERLLSKGLERHADQMRDHIDPMMISRALRNVVVHSVTQDAVLEMVARHVKPRTPDDQRLIDEFKEQTCRFQIGKHLLTHDDIAPTNVISFLSELGNCSQKTSARRS